MTRGVRREGCVYIGRSFILCSSLLFPLFPLIPMLTALTIVLLLALLAGAYFGYRFQSNFANMATSMNLLPDDRLRDDPAIRSKARDLWLRLRSAIQEASGDADMVSEDAETLRIQWTRAEGSPVTIWFSRFWIAIGAANERVPYTVTWQEVADTEMDIDSVVSLLMEIVEVKSHGINPPEPAGPPPDVPEDVRSALDFLASGTDLGGQAVRRAIEEAWRETSPDERKDSLWSNAAVALTNRSSWGAPLPKRALAAGGGAPNASIRPHQATRSTEDKPSSGKADASSPVPEASTDDGPEGDADERAPDS